jgi:hypothetical protein
MASEFYAKLGIYSDSITPDEVTSLLGIRCEKSYQEGDLIVRPHATLRQQQNAWIIYSQCPGNSALEDHVKDLLARVSACLDKIKNISDHPGTTVELGCVFYSKNAPPLFFTKDMISTLARMGAEIDIDMYFWDPTSRRSA